MRIRYARIAATGASRREQAAHIYIYIYIYIGKESDRHWEESEDPSLLDPKTVEYKRKGNAVATDEQLARTKDIAAGWATVR
jgi:hypothetical protein